jgi:hypothetical protein
MFTLFFGPQGETHELVTEWSAPNLSRTAYIAQAVVTMDPVGSGDKGPGAVRSIKKGRSNRPRQLRTVSSAMSVAGIGAGEVTKVQRCLRILH